MVRRDRKVEGVAYECGGFRDTTPFSPLFAVSLCSEIWYNAHVDGLKQIMYGVTDFALMRAENAYFVDWVVCREEV